MALKAKDQVIVARADFSQLLDSCAAAGYLVVGPTVVDGDLRYDALTSVADLPLGWTDEQEGGAFRLKPSGDQALFGYGVGQHSWKQFLFLPLKRLWQAARDGGAIKILPEGEETYRLAFLGVRACDLHALDIQDRVFMEGGYADPVYAARRRQALIIAVNCGGRGCGTCFCVSMGTGPKATAGFDLALTEVIEGNRHYFVTEIGTGLGAGIMEKVKHRPAAAQELEAAAEIVARRTAQMGRTLETAGIKELLYRNYEHPRWDDVASRCLTCGNCAMVCPTCFCHTIEDSTDITGSRAERRRRWDVCFTVDHSYLHGGSIRPSPRSRYRQWLTHKLATWIDQFGVSGCVGCGRCITWCPVGIDVRDELNAIAPAVPLVPETPIVEPVAATPNDFVTARVVATRQETVDTTTLTLTGTDPAFAQGSTGQFAMVALPGFPPLPISISRFLPDGIELTIRGAGPATKAMCALQVGEQLGLRGPLGNNWPLDRAVGRDLVIVTGGIGLAPLRPVLHAIVAGRRRFGDVKLFYGARTPADLLYRDELERWGSREGIEVSLTVDRAGPEWTGRVGIVTHLFDQAVWDGANMIAFVCGPERMMQATATTLAGRGVPASRIHVTLERHMECGIGLCGHCQMGKYFVCRDGPVFSIGQLGDIFGREGI